MMAPFRFQITAAHKAKAPIVVLEGNVMEGAIGVGDAVSVPLVNGSRFVGRVVGILHSWPDTAMHSSARAGENDKPIGIGVHRSECHEANDIAAGVVTQAES